MIAGGYAVPREAEKKILEAIAGVKWFTHDWLVQTAQLHGVPATHARVVSTKIIQREARRKTLVKEQRGWRVGQGFAFGAGIEAAAKASKPPS